MTHDKRFLTVAALLVVVVMMGARKYRLTFTSPDGLTFDASPNVEIGQLGTINESPETDLAILTHGDMAITIDNQDGAFESFIENAAPSDVYDVVLVRQLSDGGPWVRLFGGVLDLPYSLAYDDKAKTASVVAYSYTKKLERTAADGSAKTPTGLRRSLVPKTASITASTSTMVFLSGETADLEVGDIVRINDGTNLNEFTVDRIASATDVIVTEPSARTYDTAYVTVLTPYHHDKAPKQLLQLIADEIPVDFDSGGIDSPLADFPIATPLSIAGLNLSGTPLSVIPVGAEIVSTWPAAYGTTRKELDSPAPDPNHVPPLTGIWADGATSNVLQADWTPYLHTEPGTLISHDAGAGLSLVGGDADTGIQAWDFAGGTHYFYIVQNVGASYSLNLWRDGGSVNQISPSAPNVVNPYVSWFVEHDYLSGITFVSYHSIAQTSPDVIAERRHLKYRSAGVIEDLDLTRSGQLRQVRTDSTGGYMFFVDEVTNEILVFDPGLITVQPAPIRTIAWPNTIDRILVWTMRRWGVAVPGTTQLQWFSFLFERAGETWVSIWNARGHVKGWRLAAEYKLSSTLSQKNGGGDYGRETTRAFQTVMALDANTQVAVIYAGNEWFVLSQEYAGVIPYANFAKSSCAKAVRDIAVIINSVVRSDEFGTISVINRRGIGSGDVVDSIGPELDSIRKPNSELYRSSVAVSGTDMNGGDIDEVQGDQGDSARRVEIASDLISTNGMALACAVATLQFVSQIREQRDVTVVDDGTRLRVFDRVELDGREWIIYKMDTDLEQEVHHLTLLELTP